MWAVYHSAALHPLVLHYSDDKITRILCKKAEHIFNFSWAWGYIHYFSLFLTGYNYFFSLKVKSGYSPLLLLKCDMYAWRCGDIISMNVKNHLKIKSVKLIVWSLVYFSYKTFSCVTLCRGDFNNYCIWWYLQTSFDFLLVTQKSIGLNALAPIFIKNLMFSLFRFTFWEELTECLFKSNPCIINLLK